jgi:predicted ArsR family transcriptional regulator
VTAGLDEVIHAPNRLQVCAFLSATGQAGFGAVRDLLGASDSVTSKHLKVLEQAGCVRLSKTTGAGRPG